SATLATTRSTRKTTGPASTFTFRTIHICLYYVSTSYSGSLVIVIIIHSICCVHPHCA
ncbi:hypothetical protein BCR44DRAFT_1424439, partial [Catenaria anguillulae PL171]